MPGVLKLLKNGRRWGAFPSPPNPKDNGFPMHLIKQVSGDLPARFFLTGKIGAIKDQGQQGSCTAHGSCSMGERLYLRWKDTPATFSPSFIYYLERKGEGTLDKGDCGANVTTSLMIPDPAATAAVTGLSADGVGWCPLAAMPYNDAVCDVAPTAAQLAAAKAFPGGAYHSIGNNIRDIKLCIMSDYSMVIGINVYDSFANDSDGQIAARGLIPYPNMDVELLDGGHEMHSALGWDDAIQCPAAPNPGAILTQNSWGNQWGAAHPVLGGRGYCWMPYDYLANIKMTSDVRMGHLGKPW